MPGYENIAAQNGGVFLRANACAATDEFLQALLDKWLRHVKGRVRATADDPSSFHLELGFTNSADFDAFAAIDDGVDVICLSLGLVFATRDLFDALLSCPAVFPSIGGPDTMETFGPIDLEAVANKVDIAGALAGARPFKPNEPAREGFSSALSGIGLSFVFHHELGHIFNGHVDWLNATLGLRILHEVARPEGVTGLDYQTIEMDADCFAILNLLSLELNPTKGPDGKGSILHMPVPERIERIHNVLFAVYCVFRLFSGSIVDLPFGEVVNQTHPPEFYRNHYVISTAFEVIKKYNIVSEAEFIEVVKRVTSTAENAFEAASGKPRNPGVENKEIWENGTKLLSMLLENWPNLRPTLSLFKRGGNLAP